MLRGFSRQRGSTTSASRARHRGSAQRADLPAHLNAYPLSTRLPLRDQTTGWFTVLRPLFAQSKRYRNVDRLSIAYA